MLIKYFLYENSNIFTLLDEFLFEFKSHFDGKLSKFVVTHPSTMQPVDGMLLLRCKCCVGSEIMLLRGRFAISV